MADFFLLFFEGCLFVMMASVINETVTFGWVLVALLLLDSVWGFLAWLAFTGAEGQYAERIWSLMNVVTAALLVILLIFFEATFTSRPLLSEVGLFAIIAAHDFGLRAVLEFLFSTRMMRPHLPVLCHDERVRG